MDQLLQVRSDASQLKAQIMDFDQEFQQSAESLLDKVPPIAHFHSFFDVHFIENRVDAISQDFP